MQFNVYLKTKYKTLTYLVKRIYVDERIERFELIGSNKTITIETNRPFFRNRGLKHRKPICKVVAGEVLFGKPLEEIITQIIDKMDEDEKPNNLDGTF